MLLIPSGGSPRRAVAPLPELVPLVPVNPMSSAAPGFGPGPRGGIMEAPTPRHCGWVAAAAAATAADDDGNTALIPVELDAGAPGTDVVPATPGSSCGAGEARAIEMRTLKTVDCLVKRWEYSILRFQSV